MCRPPTTVLKQLPRPGQYKCSGEIRYPFFSLKSSNGSIASRKHHKSCRKAKVGNFARLQNSIFLCFRIAQEQKSCPIWMTDVCETMHSQMDDFRICEVCRLKCLFRGILIGQNYSVKAGYGLGRRINLVFRSRQVAERAVHEALERSESV